MKKNGRPSLQYYGGGIGHGGAGERGTPDLCRRRGGSAVAAVFSPTYFSSKINTEFSTIKSAQTTHTKTTATREAQAMHPISGKDSDPYAHITETPADVAKLMQQEKK